MVKYVDATQQLLPKSQRQITGRTQLAFKYSHPIGPIKTFSHKVLKHTGKSGLTPVSATIEPNTPSRRQTEDFKYKLRYYQTRRYYGFTAQDLAQLEALAPTDNETIVENSLQNPIHPIFARSQWETRQSMPKQIGPIPIRGDSDLNWDPSIGYWLAENPLVWAILEPSILLASAILFSAHIYPWFDALVSGPLSTISPERASSTASARAIQLLSIRQRSVNVANTSASRMEVTDRLENKAPKAIRLRLYSSYANPKSGLVVRSDRGYGTTYVSSGSEYIWINVALESLQPLLRDDLTETEAVMCQFKISQCLVHEVAHAFWLLLRPERGVLSEVEPFFEDELLSELGFSLVDKIFHGEPSELLNHELTRGGPGLPASCTFKTNWFTEHNCGYAGKNTPSLLFDKTPGHSFLKHQQFPVPTSWTKSLFDGDMWTTDVVRFSSAATAMGPLTYGSLEDYESPQHEDRAIGVKLLNYEMDIAEDRINSTSIGSRNLVNINELEDRRRVEADRIRNLAKRPLTARERPPSPTSLSDLDDGSDFPVIYDCPRYSEIKDYLLANRHHGQLALDSMDFHIPEPTFYRYIIDCGGLAITPLELRNFLYTTHLRQELFDYFPFPGTGTVARCPIGWPDIRPPPPLTQVKPDAAPSLVSYAIKALTNYRLLQLIQEEWGTFRDFDLETLRCILNGAARGRIRYKRSDMDLVVSEIARTHPEVMTLGPKGIARLTLTDLLESLDGIEPPWGKMRRRFSSTVSTTTQNALDQKTGNLLTNSRKGKGIQVDAVPQHSVMGTASVHQSISYEGNSLDRGSFVGNISSPSDLDLADIDLADIDLADIDSDDLDELILSSPNSQKS